MASGDYRSCDVCRKKTFYDANLYYENADDGGFLDNGEPSYSTLGDLGAWAVLCTNCAKTYAAIVTPIDQANEVAELRASLMEAVSIYEPRKSSITVEDLLSRSLRQHSWLAKAKRILAASGEQP